MRERGLEVPERWVHVNRWFSEDEGARGCAQLLDECAEVTAIVAGNDMLAIGCYDTLVSRGLRCPEHLSIAGFNDMPFVDRLSPPLTSVRVPQRELGAVAADLLLEQLAQTGATAREILLDPQLIVRESTARLPVGAGK